MASRSRDDFPASVKDTVSRRAGFRCSNPECGALTVGPSSVPDHSVNVGVASHITAAAEGGPRYDPSLSHVERGGTDNAIWLCQTCAKLIDSDVPLYTVERLRTWRRAAERTAEAMLGRSGRVTQIANHPEWITISRLPQTQHRLFGRHEEIVRLDTAWQEHQANIVCITAWGGAGKTALVNRWLASMAREQYRGARRVFAWSFYSQGQEERIASADLFIQTALARFGDADPASGSAWEKGERLARLVRASRTVLVLDGLEPLQLPPGPQEGKLKDQAVSALLTELAASNPGLCVVTSRFPLTELTVYMADTVVGIGLGPLDSIAGLELLRSMGVQGEDPDFHAAVTAFRGHALALILLGGLLADAYRGDVRRWREVGPVHEDVRQGGYARRVMRAYERWLGPGPELSILRLLGLFDRPADVQSLLELRRPPQIPNLTEAVPADDQRWQRSLAHLRRVGLLAPVSPYDPDTLDAHPLVRDHFGEELRRRFPEAWREANGRLYRLLEKTAETTPNTLAGLAPLYAAVSHGREAGLAEEALKSIYDSRIQRGMDYFAYRNLGSVAIDLSCLSRFFVSQWNAPLPELTPPTKAWLQNIVGVFLRAAGRLLEAVQATEGALAGRVAQEQWKDAAVNATNLAELRTLTGELRGAEDAARRSIEYADRSETTFWQVASRGTLAMVLHQTGEISKSRMMFEEAERREAARGSRQDILYSVRGYQYCDFLLDQGQIQEVESRAARLLQWAETAHNQLDIGLARLILARAALVQGDAMGGVRESATAVGQLQGAQSLHHVTRALIVRGACLRECGEFTAGGMYAEMALRYATKAGMWLHQADAELECARLAIAERKHGVAANALETAGEIIRTRGYGRRLAELDQVCRTLARPDLH